MNIPSAAKQQKGVVLVISLIMLLLLTIIGVTAMRTTSLEEKMAGNMRSQSLAFQSAETALRDREAWLALQTVEPAVGVNDVHEHGAVDPTPGTEAPWWSEANVAWWLANGLITSFTPTGTATAPYTITEYQFVEDSIGALGSGSVSKPATSYYTITAKGTGGTDQARVLLQSIAVRRF